MILTARQPRTQLNLDMTFVDLTKAFDTVSRAGVWKIMARFGYRAAVP